jgi:site-specific DNA recombinase
MQLTKQERTQKTALGYLRISDKKQIKGESLANQREAIHSYAYQNDIRVVEWFTDKAKSGKNADREELQNLIMTAAKMKGQIDYVLVYKMNRASRDIDSYVMMIKSQLAALGIRIRSVTEQFDDSPMGHFIENLHVMVGQLDNENKRETVIDNMRRIAQQGFWQHTPPRGYDICRLKNAEGHSRPSLTPNHEAAQVKDLLMRWNRGDMTEAQLTRYAETIKLFAQKSGKPLNQDVLHKLITNPIYAGFVCDKFTDGERVQGRHEGLITPEVFEQNQLIIKLRNKDYMSGLKRQAINELYPLRRFIRCVNCNKYMTAASPHNSPRYYCARPSCKKTGSIMTKTLHPQFEELLALVTPTKGTMKLLRELLKRQVKTELGDTNRDIKRLRDQLVENDAYKQKALTLFINGKLSEDEKDAALSGADNERVSMQAQLMELERKQTISEDNIEHALGFMGSIHKHWHSAPLELKQAYQQLVFPEGFIYDISSQKFITPALSPPYRVDLDESEAINAKNFGMVTPRRVELLLPG